MPPRPKSKSKKSQAARANGAKSHGPVTAAGRARSSRNSVRHGLAARAALPVASVVLPTESGKDFRTLLRSYLVEYDPTGPLETELVQTMATTRWRLRRLATIETTLLGNEIEFNANFIDREFAEIEWTANPADRLAYTFKQLSHSPSLGLLVRYEAALNRSYDRAFKQFHALKAIRMQAARSLPKPNEPKLPKSHAEIITVVHPPPPASAPETCPESPQSPDLAPAP
jgi:hypothetical protein